MRISTAEILAYIKCPIFYLAGRKVEVQERKIIDSLRRAIQYLYSHHMAHGDVCNFNALIKRWNQIWWGKRRPDDEEAKKLSNEAYLAIDKYYAIYLDREYDGAYTNWPYAVEVGPHIVTGVWPVVLTNGGITELYYPLVQKQTMHVIRDIIVKADVVAMDAATGNPPAVVSFSRYEVRVKDDPVKLNNFYPKKEWLAKSYETLVTLISAIDGGYIWGNCHSCKTCPLRNKCTG